ncbi:MAG: tRNA (adenosine(37)-N6)-threonylcarbamoyltransferase complex dimerization subunit type 1 TsaB [Spirochaetota bacterium]|nr:MAG: tRNA (adenosine(37)-N6)-threonylcarbamoyltransferase complex dimerization subunit type 1 TsaB [Spirochaetota bacterium]
MILSVETSTKAFSISLFHEQEVANHTIVQEAARSQHIVQAVEFLLKNLGKPISDINEAYAGIGPGSFTGIRIGLTFINTLSQTQNIPVLGIPSLDILAFEDNRWYDTVVPFVRSRKNEVYTAFYKAERRVTDYLALTKDEFVRFIAEKKPQYIVSSEDNFQDMGIVDKLQKGCKSIFSFPKASVLVCLAHKYGLKSKKQYLKPLYVRGIR